MTKIQAIILAGGKGTRLAPLTDFLPKPLVAVGGVPMILHILQHLRRAGITRVAIATAHLGQLIEQALGSGEKYGMNISYLREPEPMGTGGWSKLVDWDNLDDNFLVLNADNIFWIDIKQFLARHLAERSIATLSAIELPSTDILNYEILRPASMRMRLEAWVDRTKTQEELADKKTGFINSGWYIMTPRVREYVDDILPISNEAHIWPRLAVSGESIGFYHATEPWFDSGTHERLARVEDFLKNNPQYTFGYGE
jgi:NDP-sugar pyrophosphorylase family protein